MADNILYNEFLGEWAASYDQAVTIRTNHETQYHPNYAWDQISIWELHYNNEHKSIHLDSFTSENFNVEAIFTVSNTNNVFVTTWSI